MWRISIHRSVCCFKKTFVSPLQTLAETWGCSRMHLWDYRLQFNPHWLQKQSDYLIEQQNQQRSFRITQTLQETDLSFSRSSLGLETNIVDNMTERWGSFWSLLIRDWSTLPVFIGHFSDVKDELFTDLIRFLMFSFYPGNISSLKAELPAAWLERHVW